MAQWLFPDFLENSKTYADAKQFWESLCQKILSETGLETSWQIPWMDNAFLDGNPIFSAVSKRNHRGVRIVQEVPGEADDLDLDWWLEYVGEKTSPDAIQELVIACCPSRSNITEIERLLREWVEKGIATPSTPITPFTPNPEIKQVG